MASGRTGVPLGGTDELTNAAMQQPWRSKLRLSSIGDYAEHFLSRAGFDSGPWLAVGFAAGIALWFTFAEPWQWLAVIVTGLLVAIAASAIWRAEEGRARLRIALTAMGLVIAAGTALVWARSEMVGAEPIDYPRVERFDAKVLDREEQPSKERVRLILAMRNPDTGSAQRIRVNLPEKYDLADIREGSTIRLRARLMPPAPPMLPGGYDFARTAWFSGLAATGSVLGEVEVRDVPEPTAGLDPLQRFLSAHVRSNLGGSPGTIAAAFASGDRGSISEADDEAMRDAGLTHLLSISGLHVSAVIAAAYVLAITFLALWPWLALRVRLPMVAAAVAALAGVGYTLLTGAEVPTIRSCVGAVLVLIALALGREPLSLRMVAVAAMFVMILWPESLVGPSFQMSFAAVISIVALHNSEPVKRFLAPREESWWSRTGRRTVMLLITGFVIEIALMPIVLFHFHRAGVYGALANVIAIPLTTFITMPLIAIALAMDVVGIGAPAWWLVGKSLDLMLAIAHFTAEQPGAVKLAPHMGRGVFAIFLVGGFWLALWRSKTRLLGLIPSGVAAIFAATAPVPDVLVSSDGRHVGIAGEGDRLLMLRDSRSSYASDNLLEMAGMSGETIPLNQWDGAQCSRDFCSLTIERDGRQWSLLMARSRDFVDERPLAAACDRADIVIADRFLPRSCRPKWLKADRNLLGQEGGLAIYLPDQRIDSVADHQGKQGWWRPWEPRSKFSAR
ncbi:ComEC/Rec2 family competence protein [Altererythrobacter sp. ZODW24]|uniref:ComEC/Rec2 family competence protein n=1 Tax=Altererythrobacter sp. ZODW24 TaxID=2185142 RepID=UPI000DF77DE4|nr:ComEC/Rec2 family competence protein [Altererythrobacter sp. ZODW24]